MSDETTPAAAPAAPAASPPETFSDAREAMNWLSSQQSEKQDTNSSAESAEPATAEHESATTADTAPREEATGETQETAPAETPPRELPRSWSKDKAEYWSKLDPSVQDYLLEQDSKVSAEVRRAQNEAAEARKAVEAKQSADQQKAQLGEKAQSLKAELAVLKHVNDTQFSDITSQADLDRIQAEYQRLTYEDPVAAIQLGARLDAWRNHQYKMQAKAQDLQQTEQGATTEFQQARSAYAAEQDRLFREAMPEFKDQEKLNAALKRAVPILDEYGMSTDKLQKWCESRAGYEIIGSAGFQRLVADALKYRDVKAAANTARQAPVPPVQRPGSRQNSGGNTSALQAATQAFNLNPTAKNAAALRIAKAQAASRH